MNIIQDTNVLGSVERPKPRELFRDQARSVSLKTGQPVEEVKDSLSVSDRTPVSSARQNPLKSPVDYLFEQGVTPEEGKKVWDEYVQKHQDNLGGTDYFIDQAFILENPEYSSQVNRYVNNINIAEQIFQEEINNNWEESSTLGLVWDFFDREFLRALPIGAVESVTGRTGRKGDELAQAAMDMSPEEYRAFIKDYVSELKDEGFFTGDNVFALMQGFEELVTQGYDPNDSAKRIFGAIELAPFATGALRAGKGVGKGLFGRVGTLDSQEALDEAVSASLKDSPDPSVIAASTPSELGGSDIRASTGVSVRISDGNELIQRINADYEEGIVSKNITPEEVSELADEFQADLDAEVNNSMLDSNIIHEGRDNWVMTLDWGTTKGSPFKTQSSAQKLANRLDGTVVEVDGGFRVRIQKRADTSRFIKEGTFGTEQRSFLGDIYLKFFGSATADDPLAAAAYRAEGATARLVEHFDRVTQPAIRALSTSERQSLDVVLSRLRDGPDASKRDWYSEAEFVQLFEATGLKATDTVKEAYHRVREAADAAWLIDADRALQIAVRDRKTVIDTGNGAEVLARPVDNVPDGTEVFDARAGRTVVPSEGTQVYRLDAPTEGGVQFVVNPVRNRVVSYEDVMPYNSGGFRSNIDSRFFIGTKTDNNFKALLGSFSVKEAQLAVVQLNKIGAAIRKGSTGKQLDEIIAKNNDWNPNIEDSADLSKLSDETGYDFSKETVFRGRDEPLRDGEAGLTVGDNIRLNRTKRTDQVLHFYGGGKNRNFDPVLSVQKQFVKSATKFAHKNYTDAAVISWVKKAQTIGYINAPDVLPNDYFRWFREARISGKDAGPSKFAEQREKIMRRLHMHNAEESRWGQTVESATEFVYGASKAFSKLTGGKVPVFMKDFTRMDGSAALLWTGFMSKFGFFNPAQFIVQGFQAATIAAISPVAGTRAAMLALPLRMAMFAPNESARAMAFTRLANVAGMNRKDVVELIDHIKVSGRAHLGTDLPELQEGAVFSRSSLVGRALDKSTFFFQEGELFSRLTGITTAILEFKKKFPKMSLRSEFAKNWVSKREQDLTFRMTTTSRSMAQSGLLRVPTQWMTFTMRAIENIAVGRDFSKAERLRMAMVLGPMFGVTGITVPKLLPLNSAAQWMSDQVGGDVDTFKTFQYGLFDTMLRELTGSDTAIATRLAPLGQFGDFLNKLYDGETTPLGLALGPSGEIAGDTLGAVHQSLGNLFSGRPISTQIDIKRALRNISTVDNLFKAAGIYASGVYQSKTGKSLPLRLQEQDAIFQSLGFSSMEVQEYYRQNSHLFQEQKVQNRWYKSNVEPYYQQVQNYMLEGNYEAALALSGEIGWKIQNSGFPERVQVSFRKRMGNYRPETIVDIWKKAIRLGIDFDPATLGAE